MNQFLFGYLAIGGMISWSLLRDDQELSKPDWLLSLVLVAMTWPAFLLGVILGVKSK